MWSRAKRQEVTQLFWLEHTDLQCPLLNQQRRIRASHAPTTMFRMSINCCVFLCLSSLDCSRSHRACSAPPSSVPWVLRSYTATTSPWSTPRVRWVTLVYKMDRAADAMHVKMCLYWYDIIISMVLVKEFRWVTYCTTATLVLHLMLNIWVHKRGSAFTLTSMQKFYPRSRFMHHKISLLHRSVLHFSMLTDICDLGHSSCLMLINGPACLKWKDNPTPLDIKKYKNIKENV